MTGSEQWDTLERQAAGVLTLNDMGNYTVPQAQLFGHDWLWDGVAAAVGWRHLDSDRAGREIESLFVGQWRNGMVPNITFREGHFLGAAGQRAWAAYGDRPVPTSDYLFHLSRFRNNDNVPPGVNTSGITQPPIIAEGVQKVGQKMERDDRRGFYAAMVGPLAAYHSWIYRDRNYGNDDLFAAVHPWETGMDNTPPWTEHMASLDWGLSGQLIGAIAKRAQSLRPDTKLIDVSERSSLKDNVLQDICQLTLLRKGYDARRLADGYPLHVQDVLMNSVLVRNNQVLRELAEEIGQPLPDDLLAHMAGTEFGMDKLWDEDDGLYYSRDAVSGRLLKIPTVASLMPLYGGALSAERANRLVGHLTNPESFGIPNGVPTVPVNSSYYRPKQYWSGPAWIYPNWLLSEGSARSGYRDVSRRIGANTLELVAAGGMHEYFSRDGKGLGVDRFTWTASLAFDIIAESNF